MRIICVGLLVLLCVVCSYGRGEDAEHPEKRPPHYRARFTVGMFSPNASEYEGRFMNINLKHSTIWERLDFGFISAGGSGEFGFNSFNRYLSFIVTYAKVGPEIRLLNFYLNGHIGMTLVTVGIAGFGAEVFYGFNAGYIQRITNRLGIELEAGTNHAVRTELRIDYVSLGLTFQLRKNN